MPATSVVATDLVPAVTTYVAASCTVAGGSVNTCSSSGAAAGSTVTFNMGNLAASASATLTFKVLVDNPSADGDTITNSGQVTAATNIVGQTYTAYSNLVQYPIVASPVINVVKAANPASGSNVGVGDIYRKDPVRGDYVRLNPHLLPALNSDCRGGVYRYVDPTAVAGATQTYGVEEIEITGRTRHYGPYTVTYGIAAARTADRVRAVSAAKDEAAIAQGFERKLRAASGRVVALADAPAQASTQVDIPAAAAVTAPATAKPTSVSILVAEDGLYTVTAKDLAAAWGSRRCR